MFKKLSAMFGGGASVDTVLASPHTRPGDVLRGEVRISGGNVEMVVDRVELELVAKVEVEGESAGGDDYEYNTMLPFQRLHLGHRFSLQPGARHAVPFELAVPWETPVTTVNGQPLHGMRLGVRTELELAGSLDKGDMDPIQVNPLPAQARLLDAFSRLGFQFKGADLERGTLYGSRLPFYQEIEYYPAHQYAGTINELEVTFISGPQSMDVLLELDKRGGFLTSGSDAYNRFTVQYAGAEQLNWEQWLHEHLQILTQRRGMFH
ncbi:sporulation protein [Cryptosporangium arvum]|uniref:Sporulation control protein n=1 Tax=Cryptosporangium arvum DSM 44712 TaxID=927661 RepID=A0A010YGU2_9ACTN|nr:sporulation protein [Cryptosporangium arvum]EXG79490.1 sporulation control protein [Cryptosporangium arvum DSM 44712]